MVCTVFTNNREKAEEKLEEIKNIKGNLVRLWKSKDRLEYDFEDGECWRWVRVNDHGRGVKAYKAWIDKEINKNTLSLLVLPCCAHCHKDNIFYF